MAGKGLRSIVGSNDGRKRYGREPTYSQNIRITARERRALEYLADFYDRPFNETFRHTLEMALREFGLSLDNVEFKPADERAGSTGTPCGADCAAI